LKKTTTFCRVSVTMAALGSDENPQWELSHKQILM